MLTRPWESRARFTGGKKIENPEQWSTTLPRSLENEKLFSGWAVAVAMHNAVAD